MDYLPLVITILLAVLTVMLVVVGVLVVQVLLQVKKTINRVNTTIDLAEEKIVSIGSPLQSLTGMATSLGTGLKVFESFIGFLNKSKRSRED
jgi:hypothetical protein